MSKPFVVIGGDAAGLSAASKCRRENPDRSVVVLERGRWVSYAFCGMPYYVKGDIPNLTDLLSLEPEDVADRGIELRRSHEVLSIDTDTRTVTVETPAETYEQDYGDLLIATGASATSGPFDLDLTGVFTMHHMDSAAALRAALTPPAEIDPEAVDGPYVDRERVRRNADLEPPGTAAVIGGGYVGVEMAEALAAWDVTVHVFQRPDRLLPPFGAAVGDRVENHLEEHGIHVHTGTAVQTLRGEERVSGVTHDEGELEVDLAVVGIGVTPNTALLEGTDLETGPAGAIAVDDYGRTAAPDVYAAGDCAEDTHVVTDEPTWSPLGLAANRAGRAVGATVAGEATPVGETAETALVKAMDLGAGRTGILDHDRARQAGFQPVSETITAGSRSGYYPGAAETTVTLTADRSTGQVLGAATVGEDRAAKRIDTVASALAGGLTVGELERVDAGYAPPFSPVWDPILVAAKVLAGSVPSPASGDPK
jgi:NADPH-dependent 2,4-dienoyl-CoA reductase/sulfur reductase-like enzyme